MPALCDLLEVGRALSQHAAILNVKESSPFEKLSIACTCSEIYTSALMTRFSLREH